MPPSPSRFGFLPAAGPGQSWRYLPSRTRRQLVGYDRDSEPTVTPRLTPTMITHSKNYQFRLENHKIDTPPRYIAILPVQPWPSARMRELLQFNDFENVFWDIPKHGTILFHILGYPWPSFWDIPWGHWDIPGA